jgi:hypothetical protein
MIYKNDIYYTNYFNINFIKFEFIFLKSNLVQFKIIQRIVKLG